MRKVIVVSSLFVLLVGGYLGRGYFPSDQLKQDILIDFLGSVLAMQLHIDEALEHYEEDDIYAFTIQLKRAAADAESANKLISGAQTNHYFDIPHRMLASHMTILNLSETAILHEFNQDDLKSLRKINHSLSKLIDSIGTPKELGKDYTPSSQLLGKIISGYEEVNGF